MAGQLIKNGRYTLQLPYSRMTLATQEGLPPAAHPPSDSLGDAAKWEIVFDGVDSYTLRNIATGTYLGSDVDPAGPAPMLAMTKPFAWLIQAGPEGTFTLSPRGSNGAMQLSLGMLKLFPPPVGWLPAGSSPDQNWSLTFLEAVPQGFPQGDFRIINEDTGQALYTDLGSKNTITYHRLGNETTYVISDKPKVGVRTPAGGAVEAWYFHAGADPWGHHYFQIVSVAVARTNLGNYCLSRNDFPSLPNSPPIYMYGCGTNRNAGNDWRWQTEYGYIWAADNAYSSQDRSYLTLADGRLTAEPKGRAGQRWRFEAPK